MIQYNCMAICPNCKEEQPVKHVKTTFNTTSDVPCYKCGFETFKDRFYIEALLVWFSRAIDKKDLAYIPYGCGTYRNEGFQHKSINKKSAEKISSRNSETSILFADITGLKDSNGNTVKISRTENRCINLENGDSIGVQENKDNLIIYNPSSSMYKITYHTVEYIPDIDVSFWMRQMNRTTSNFRDAHYDTAVILCKSAVEGALFKLLEQYSERNDYSSELNEQMNLKDLLESIPDYPKGKDQSYDYVRSNRGFRHSSVHHQGHKKKLSVKESSEFIYHMISVLLTSYYTLYYPQKIKYFIPPLRFSMKLKE